MPTDLHRPPHHHPPRAVRLRFRFRLIRKHRHQQEEFHFTMQQNLIVGQTCSVVGSPVDASGNPSSAALSAQNYVSSDPTIFTVASDPSTPGGSIITAVGAGSATLTETATATETSGATESIQGVATLIITAAPPPPPPPAASLVFTFTPGPVPV